MVSTVQPTYLLSVVHSSTRRGCFVDWSHHLTAKSSERVNQQAMRQGGSVRYFAACAAGLDERRHSTGNMWATGLLLPTQSIRPCGKLGCSADTTDVQPLTGDTNSIVLLQVSPLPSMPADSSGW